MLLNKGLSTNLARTLRFGWYITYLGFGIRRIKITDQVQPEHGMAVASLVLGIVGVVCWFFGVFSIISVILGIIGLLLSLKAKNEGNTEGIRVAGFVLSLISLIGGSVVFLACIACVGSSAAIGSMYNY